MKQTKKLLRVQMYFTDDMKPLYEELIQFSKRTGLSQSDVAMLGFIAGFDGLKETFKDADKIKKAKAKK